MPSDTRPNVETILARATTDTATTPDAPDWYAPTWGTDADLCRYILHLESRLPQRGTTESDEEAAREIVCDVIGWRSEHNETKAETVVYHPDEMACAIRGIAHGREQAEAGTVERVAAWLDRLAEHGREHIEGVARLKPGTLAQALREGAWETDAG